MFLVLHIIFCSRRVGFSKIFSTPELLFMFKKLGLTYILHFPRSIYRYMKYLYPYECDKKNLSTPSELQAAIDGNRREGRRSSYGQYEAMHAQLQMVSKTITISIILATKPLLYLLHMFSLP